MESYTDAYRSVKSRDLFHNTLVEGRDPYVDIYNDLLAGSYMLESNAKHIDQNRVWENTFLELSKVYSLSPEAVSQRLRSVLSMPELNTGEAVSSTVERKRIVVGELAFDITPRLQAKVRYYGSQDMINLCLRYVRYEGTSMMREVGAEVYKWIQSNNVNCIECFASPIDNTLPDFCSLFGEGLGDFFQYAPSLDQAKLLLINPPPLREVIELSSKVASEYVARVEGSGAIFFLKEGSRYLGDIDANVIPFPYPIYTIGSVPDLSPIARGGMFPILMKLERSWTFRWISVTTDIPIETVQRVLRSGVRSDRDYLYMLRDEIKRRSNEERNNWTNTLDDLQRKALSMVKDLSSYLEQVSEMEGSYVDVGAFNGSITRQISLASKAERTYGYDLKNMLSVEGIDYISSLSSLKGSSVKLVTMMMSLHHIKDPRPIMKEIKRVLKPNGLLIVREHNFKNHLTECRVMLQHLVLDVVIGSDTYANALMNNLTYPRSLNEIEKVIGMKRKDLLVKTEGVELMYMVFYA